MSIFMRALVLVLAMGLSACGEEKPKKEVAKRLDVVAKDVELRGAEDSSAGDQKRARVYIQEKELSPVAADERAYVAAMFAHDLAEKLRYDYVDVFLVAAGTKSDRQNVIVASAKYAPNPAKIPFMDKKWEIKASDTALTDQQVLIANEWAKSRADYLDKDGMLDEDRLIAALAKKLKLSEDDIGLPFVMLDQSFDFKLYQMSEANKNHLEHMASFVCLRGRCQ